MACSLKGNLVSSDIDWSIAGNLINSELHHEETLCDVIADLILLADAKMISSDIRSHSSWAKKVQFLSRTSTSVSSSSLLVVSIE